MQKRSLFGIVIMFTVLTGIGFASSQVAFAGIGTDLNLSKVANPDTVLQGQGTQVTYTFTTENDLVISGVPQDLFNCSLVDDNGTPGDTNDDITIFSNEVILFGSPARVDMVQTGISDTTTNTATLTCSTDSEGNQVQMASETVTAITPSIDLRKTADPTTILTGDTTDYDYELENDGDADLVCGDVVDDNGTPGNPNDDFVVLSGQTVLAGQTVLFSNNGVVLTQDTTNTADVECNEPETNTDVSDDASATVTVLDPSIELLKSADPTLIMPGETTDYSYSLENTGDADLDCSDAVDDNGTPGDTNDDFVVFAAQTLLAGGLLTADINGVVLQQTTTNTVDVTCNEPETNTDFPDDASATVTVETADVDLTKVADDTLIMPGDMVTYTYEITNNGDQDTVCTLGIIDDNGTPGDTNDDFVVTGSVGAVVLANGGTAQFMETVTLQQSTTNIATVTCTDDNGFDAMAMATETVTVETADVELTKVANPDTIMPGEMTTYTYEITNLGSADTICDLGISDDNGTPGDTNDDFVVTGSINAAVAANGGTAQFTHDKTLQVTTTNIAMVECTDQNGFSDIAMASETVTVEASSIQLIKLADPTTITEAGDMVTYTYDATNNGDTDLDCGPIIDDNGTPGNTNDDIDVSGGDVGILLSGNSANFQNTIPIFFATTNTAKIICTDDQQNIVMDDDSATVNLLVVGGEFLPIDSTALLIAGMSANMGFIAPIVLGIAGAGYYLVRTRMNKE